MSVEIDKEHHIAILQVEGYLDPERVMGLRNELEQHPEYRSDMAVLYDLSEVPDWGKLPGSMINRVESMVQGLNAHAVPVSPNIAIVVPSEVGYGIARMYASVAEERIPDRDDIPKARKVFRSRADALDWLRSL